MEDSADAKEIFYIVDRIVEDMYTLEDQNTNNFVTFDKESMPENTREGDVLVLKDDQLFFDEEQTQKRREHIQNLFSALKREKL